MTDNEMKENPQVMEPATPVQKKKGSTAKKKKRIKTIISLSIVAVILAGVGFGIYKLFAPKDDNQVLTDISYIGMIETSVTGGGVTTPTVSEPVVQSFASTIESVFVMSGDNVNAGDPIYSIDVTEMQKNIKAAEAEMLRLQQNYQDQLNAPTRIANEIAELSEKRAGLNVRPAFDGKLVNAVTLKPGDYVSEGEKLADLFDDSKMRLSLYFSYAYQKDIKIGMGATVSVPSTMSNIPGKVENIDMVERISQEGTKLFKVSIVMSNPGTLTEGVAASAKLSTAGGETILPYEVGVLEYYQVGEFVSMASGEVKSTKLMDYLRVKTTDNIITLINDEYSEEISSKTRELSNAQANTDAALEEIDLQQKKLDEMRLRAEDNIVVAPVTGMINGVSIIDGQKVEAGTTVMTISDASSLKIDIQIDALNISDVSVGDEVTITQYGMEGDMIYYGTIESISLEGKYENNYSYFPAVVRVDNSDGSIMTGVYVDYSIVANSSYDCVVIPIQAVKNTDVGEVVFVRADSRPDEAIDVEGVDAPNGFYAVPVTTGLSDNYSVEIISGLEPDVEVFTQYMTDSASSWDTEFVG